MKRRGLLALGLGALLAGQRAGAQEAAPTAPVASTQTTAPPATSTPPAARPARRPRRPRQAAKPESMPRKAEPVAPDPPGEPMVEAAPVPNRNLEAPRVVEKDAPSLSPSVIQRALPSRGQATEGSVSLQEERLFNPAPGARLHLPFRY